MHIRDLSAAARRLATAWPLQPQAILRWRPDRFTLLLAALALLGAALILARQVNYGVSINTDSINFITVARNLLAGEGLVELSTKTDFIVTPPLYPLLLAGSSLFIFDPLDVCRTTQCDHLWADYLCCRAVATAAHSLPLPRPLDMSRHSVCPSSGSLGFHGYD